jgi:hypothetical protein
MKCAEFEPLIDSYLDGELCGSLRLEFDAHRLRCRRCQLSVAMMESVQHVVAADHETPAPLTLRLRPTRVAVVAGALLQAAAVIYMAVMWPSKPNAPTQPPTFRTIADVYRDVDAKTDRREALYDDVVSRVEAARSRMVADFGQLARYPLTLAVSDDFARASANVDDAGPLGFILEAVVPAAPEDNDSLSSPGSDQHSL